MCSEQKREPGVASLLLSLIRGYQLLISPYLSPSCRFFPSCSVYAGEAIRARGVIRGVVLATWRIIRCNPWNKGGFDPVPLGKESDKRQQ